MPRDGHFARLGEPEPLAEDALSVLLDRMLDNFFEGVRHVLFIVFPADRSRLAKIKV